MNQIVLAVNERAFQEIFAAVRDSVVFDDVGTKDVGPFVAAWDVALHLENGTIDLRGDSSVRIAELDVVWDRLKVGFGIDIPTACVGGWCIAPTPWGCAVRLPSACFFTDAVDLGLSLDLSGLLRSELSVIAEPVVRYAVDPGRATWMDDVDAHLAGVPNLWQVLLHVRSVDVDVFDLADIVGDLLEDAIDAVVDDLLFFLPGWARALVKALLGPLVDVVRAALDIGDDVQEWLEDLLGTSLGLLDVLTTVVANMVADHHPLEIEDPYPVLPQAGVLIPASVPVQKFDVHITDDEMVVTATVGP